MFRPLFLFPSWTSARDYCILRHWRLDFEIPMNFLVTIGNYLGLTDYLRPLLIVFVCVIFWNIQAVFYKLRLFAEAILFMIFCIDKSWKKESNPKRFFDPVLNDETRKVSVVKKTIIFVRHGESTVSYN